MAPGAQEGSVSVANATGPPWSVRSGCLRAHRTRDGPAPTEKGLCATVYRYLSLHRQGPRMVELVGSLPNLAASELPQGHVKTQAQSHGGEEWGPQEL
jgi:hypothetical protein